MKRVLKTVLVMALMLTCIGTVYGFSNYLTSFNATYGTAGTALDTCTTCHNPDYTRNPYGSAYGGGHNFQAIESTDSDSDSFTNIDEINARTFPGDAASHPVVTPPSPITPPPATPPPATPPPSTPPPSTPPPSAPPPSAGMPLPAGQSMYPYGAAEAASVGMNPGQVTPMGLGAVAHGGNTMDLNVSIGNMAGPSDVYLGVSVPGDPDNMFILRSDYTIQPMSAGLVPWKPNTTGPINETLLSGMPVDGLTPGTYTFYLLLTPANDLGSFYLWLTAVTVAGNDGTILYAQNCAGCHGALATSSKIGRTASQIQGAINASNNLYSMGHLSSLTPSQVQAIADVLAQQAPPPPPPTTNGTTLYAQNCAGCHGALSRSTKAGATAMSIRRAISANVGGMGSLKNLTSMQIQAIATVLGRQTPPPPPTTTDGPTLYAQNCASCHGTLASSTKKNRTATQIQNAINAGTGGMGSTALRALTTTQVAAIATALVSATPPPPPPTDGPTL
ncbi:MAG: c-type cytochrome, partial [Nitrospirae bacterium]|nr:c-type cytochrome [Nitrospirota bacterium]